ncbi:hypothetical protein ABEH87_21585, partial [Erwinia sp. Eh17-17]
MIKLRKALTWVLCAVMAAGAVACAGEKGASGQKVAVPEVQQGKCFVTDGKHREKVCTLAGCAAEKVVVENNSLSGDKARESVKQNAEHWKDQVRDKLGNGTTSSIANGI